MGLPETGLGYRVFNWIETWLQKFAYFLWLVGIAGKVWAVPFGNCDTSPKG